MTCEQSARRQWLLHALRSLPALEQCLVAAVHFPGSGLRIRGREAFAAHFDFSPEEVDELEARALEAFIEALVSRPDGCDVENPPHEIAIVPGSGSNMRVNLSTHPHGDQLG
jgi:hypothetical protein